MVQESWLDTVCIIEKLKPRSAIKGTLRGVRGGENSPYSITLNSEVGRVLFLTQRRSGARMRREI